MIVDLPSTTTAAMSKKLVALRNDVGAMALGRVLTLLIVADESDADEAIEAANDASRQHPCRIIAIVTGNKRGASRLDAQIRVGGDAGASEVVVLRLYGALADHGDSVVIPLLLPDSPVVAWWPRGAPARRLGRTRSGRWPSAASPTPPRPRNPHKELQRRAGDLPARRHRPGLDPGHPVAWAARGRARPAAVRAGHRRPPSPAAATPRRPTCSPPGWPRRCAAR